MVARTRSRGASAGPNPSPGFSLVELGIVLGVMTIILGIAIPDMVELAKNQLAKEAAQQVTTLQEQLQAYYRDTLVDSGGNILPPGSGRWPGENGPATCAPLAIGPFDPPIQQLIDSGFLTAGQMTNPWGYLIEANLVAGTSIIATVANTTCRVRLSTDVPAEIAPVLQTHLPGGICGPVDCPGMPPPGHARCCALTTKPSLETALTAVVGGWGPMP